MELAIWILAAILFTTLVGYLRWRMYTSPAWRRSVGKDPDAPIHAQRWPPSKWFG
jgi:hypothetical protein